MLADSSTIDVTHNDAGDAETFDGIQTAPKPTESLIVAAGDETTAITTGTGKVPWRMPYAFTVTEVRASLVTPAVISAASLAVDAEPFQDAPSVGRTGDRPRRLVI
ncbi:MAG: hypothetical protein ACM3W4_03835 [Ignavibacteriales bacterium]